MDVAEVEGAGDLLTCAPRRLGVGRSRRGSACSPGSGPS